MFTYHLKFLNAPVSRVISLNRAHPISGEIVMRLQLDCTIFVFRIIDDDERCVDVIF